MRFTRKRLVIAAVSVPLAAGLLIAAPNNPILKHNQRAAEADILVACRPNVGPPAVWQTSGSKRTRGRICWEWATNQTAARIYIGLACEGLDPDGVWRAHNYCRWDVSRAELWETNVNQGANLRRTLNSVMPAPPNFGANATMRSLYYNPPGCWPDGSDGSFDSEWFSWLRGSDVGDGSWVRYNNNVLAQLPAQLSFSEGTTSTACNN